MRLRIKAPSPAQVRYDPYRMGVNQSTLTAWLTCREKARLRLYEGIEKAQKAKPLIQGDIGHKLLAQCYRENPKDVASCLSEMIGQAEDNVLKTGSTTMQEEIETLQMMEALLPVYFEQYKLDMCMHWRYVEHSLVIPACKLGVSIPYICQIDGGFIAPDKPDRLLILETKFKANWTQGYIDSLGLGLQTVSYIAAAHASLPEKPSQMVYNLIRKPQLRIKKGETRKQFVTRVQDDIQTRRDFYFQRYKVSLSPSDISKATQRLRALISEFEAWHRKCTLFPGEQDLCLNGEACSGKYGPCPYLERCTSGTSVGYSRVLHPLNSAYADQPLQ